MTDSIFECDLWVPCKIEAVFKFFAEVNNLENITPPLLNFRILGMNTDVITEGSLIDYKLKIHGFPIKWQTRISKFKINEMFIDEQLQGPYKKWIHTHTFEEKDKGTLIKDHVQYQIPFGTIGSILLGKMIKKDIDKIFNYRTNYIKEHFKNDKQR